MHNTAQKRRTHRGTRGHRNHGFFAPSFGNIINEIMNSPLHEVVSDRPKRFSNPNANIISEDGKYILSLAIPGVAKENVTINIEKNKLTVKSNVEDKTDVKYRLREFNYTNFDRTFTLSDDVDIDNISARFENGILSITIPTLEEAGPQKVEIA